MNRALWKENNKNTQSFRLLYYMAALVFITAFGLLCPFMAYASAPSVGSYPFSGIGSPEDPYTISNLVELQALRYAVSQGNSFSGKFIRLSADIDLPENWQGIGTLKEGCTTTENGRNILPFSGVFDGCDHTVRSAESGKPLFQYLREAKVKNLKIAGKNINGSGLIYAYTTDRGEKGNSPKKIALIENVTIVSGTSIQGSGIASGYAAKDNTIDIINCTAEEGVVVGCNKDREKVGSFGGDFNGIIENCKSAATVYGTSYVGGIMGCRGNSMSNTFVRNCIFTGKVIASGFYAGGIAGGSYGGTGFGINSAPNAFMLSITNCLCSGSIEAENVAGGIEGYETTVQVWNNGKGYLQSNLFTGTIQVSPASSEGEGEPVSIAGGLVGAFRGMDRYNIVQDNYYTEDCGADRGIGQVEYLDTSCSTHETVYGIHYFNSGVAIPVFPGINDAFPHNLREDHNRTDDPLGADAELLARAVTSGQMEDGTVTAWLNDAAGSLKNWKQEDGRIIPEIIYVPSEDPEYDDTQPSDQDPSTPQPDDSTKAKDPTDSQTVSEKASGTTAKKTAARIQKGKNYLVGKNKYRVTKVATAKANGTVTFFKAKNAKTITIPAKVKLKDGRKYKVNRIAKKAFAGRRTTVLILKTAYLKNAGIKGCLKASKIKTIKIRVGSKRKNKRTRKTYKKIFTKKNAGKIVKIK